MQCLITPNHCSNKQSPKRHHIQYTKIWVGSSEALYDSTRFVRSRVSRKSSSGMTNRQQGKRFVSIRSNRVNRQHFQTTLHSPPEVEIREIKTREPSLFLKRGHNFSRFIRFVSNRSNRSWCTWRGCCKKCAVAGKVCKSSTHNATTKTEFNFSLFYDARIQTGLISWYMLREQHFVSQLLLEKRQVTRVKNFRCNLSPASVWGCVDL